MAPAYLNLAVLVTNNLIIPERRNIVFANKITSPKAEVRLTNTFTSGGKRYQQLHFSADINLINIAQVESKSCNRCFAEQDRVELSRVFNPISFGGMEVEFIPS